MRVQYPITRREPEHSWRGNTMKHHSPLKPKAFKHVRLSWHILAYAGLTTTQIAMYAALLSFRGRAGIFASHETLGKRAGCSRRTAIRTLAELEAIGLFTIAHRAINGLRTSNLYIMQDDILAEKLAVKYLKTNSPRCAKNDTPLTVPKTTQDIYLNQITATSLHEDPPQNIIPITTKYRLPRMKPLHSRKQEQG